MAADAKATGDALFPSPCGDKLKYQDAIRVGRKIVGFRPLAGIS